MDPAELRKTEEYYFNESVDDSDEEEEFMLLAEWRRRRLGEASNNRRNSGAYSSSLNADTNTKLDDCEIRAIRKKVAKAKAKRKGKSKMEASRIEEEMKEYWAKMKELRKAKFAKMLEFRKPYEIAQHHRILTTDTSHMNAEQLENHRFLCDAVKAKYANKYFFGSLM